VGVRDVVAGPVEASVIERPPVQPLAAASRLRLKQPRTSRRRIKDILHRNLPSNA
jgi:hypothetical protein